MAEKEKKFIAYIGAFQYPEVDYPENLKNSLGLSHPTYESFLKFVSDINTNKELDDFIRRYKMINKGSNSLFALPFEKNIFEKLVLPLRNAMSSFTLGDYLGTIALCGMVSEMVAILHFEITDKNDDGVVIDGNLVKQEYPKLNNCSFEKLGQKQRVKFLRKYEIIDDNLKEDFDNVRNIRKRYIHFFSQKHTSLQKDAIKAYNSTVKLVSQIIGKDIVNGKIILNPKMERHLKKKGILEVSE